MASLQLLTFEKFSDKTDAIELSTLLAQHNIQSEIEDTSKYFDPSFAFNTANNYFAIKIAGKDFAEANKIVDERYKGLLSNIPNDYYLYQFTDIELAEILHKPDDWGRIDYLLAQKILKERGRQLSDSQVASLINARMVTLSKPRETNWPFVIAGYIFSFLGGVPGLIIALMILQTKRTLPNGNSFYQYNNEERAYAKGMIICFIVTLLFTFYFLSLK